MKTNRFLIGQEVVYDQMRLRVVEYYRGLVVCEVVNEPNRQIPFEEKVLIPLFSHVPDYIKNWKANLDELSREMRVPERMSNRIINR